MSEAAIMGWAHSPFGKLAVPDIEGLIDMVAAEALTSANLPAADVDAVFIGVFNAGLSRQEFPSSLVMNQLPELRFKAAVRVENACATGAAAVFAARSFIESGQGRTALVIGVEKMTAVPTAKVGECLMGASYIQEEAGLGSFPGVFAHIAQEYFARYGDQSDALATIAAKNHRNGVDNVYAQIRRDLGFDYCRHPSEKNPFVAPPLKRTDCSLVSDGAAALVLGELPLARSRRNAVRFCGSAHVNDFLPLSRRDPTRFEGAALAWSKALNAAGLRLDDLSFVETHDCFTIAELLEYEAMGLSEWGQGARAALDGWTQADGRLPVNRSGGLKSKGHPIGATGVSMHVLAALQLTGQAGNMQLAEADTAGIFNMGGAAVANYVSILRRLGD